MTRQTFNDGIAEFYTVTNTAERGNKPNNILVVKSYVLRYDSKTVGIKRFYTALQNQIEISMLIRTLYKDDVSMHDVVIINGRQLEIVQIQYPEDVWPKCMDLSLRKVVTEYVIT